MRAQSIFIEDLPVIGNVPMTFYLPPSPERSDMKALIEQHGGLVSSLHECFSYQIAPLNHEVPRVKYFCGDVYRAQWLIASIKDGHLRSKKNYFMFTNTAEGSKRMEFCAGKVKYTLTEGLKIFSIALANSSSEHRVVGLPFWREIQRRALVPIRAAESMRNFWKTNSRKGLEQYLNTAMKEDTRYCHAFNMVPKVRILSVNADHYQEAKKKIFELYESVQDPSQEEYKNDQVEIASPYSKRRSKQSCDSYQNSHEMAS